MWCTHCIDSLLSINFDRNMMWWKLKTVLVITINKHSSSQSFVVCCCWYFLCAFVFFPSFHLESIHPFHLYTLTNFISSWCHLKWNLFRGIESKQPLFIWTYCYGLNSKNVNLPWTKGEKRRRKQTNFYLNFSSIRCVCCAYVRSFFLSLFLFFLYLKCLKQNCYK